MLRQRPGLAQPARLDLERLVLARLEPARRRSRSPRGAGSRRGGAPRRAAPRAWSPRARSLCSAACASATAARSASACAKASRMSRWASAWSSDWVSCCPWRSTSSAPSSARTVAVVGLPFTHARERPSAETSRRTINRPSSRSRPSVLDPPRGRLVDALEGALDDRSSPRRGGRCRSRRARRAGARARPPAWTCRRRSRR